MRERERPINLFSLIPLISVVGLSMIRLRIPKNSNIEKLYNMHPERAADPVVHAEDIEVARGGTVYAIINGITFFLRDFPGRDILPPKGVVQFGGRLVKNKDGTFRMRDSTTISLHEGQKTKITQDIEAEYITD